MSPHRFLDAPLHEITRDLPFFGDTTSNQAILFSPVFQNIEIEKPTYPNYTLPAAGMAQPDQPTNSSNLTLIISPTSSGLANKVQTGCFLSSQLPLGTVANETFWARDEQGWRRQWLMGGLTPSTNYTAYVLLNNTKVSGPIFFSTKSGMLYFPLNLSWSNLIVFKPHSIVRLSTPYPTAQAWHTPFPYPLLHPAP
jgi:calcium channel MID1